jgi:LacI family transcriptional regulator
MQGLGEKDVSRILWSRGIRGVLLAPNESKPDPRYELDWAKFATVLVGSSLVNMGLTRVARDYFHDAKLAITAMREEGNRRVGLVLGASTHERTDRRYAAAFDAHGGHAQPHLVDPAMGDSDARRRFQRWLARIKPVALITDTARVRPWMPAGMPLASLTLVADEPGPGVLADFERVGAEAMRMLDGLLRGGCLGLQSEPMSLLVPGGWVPGELRKIPRGGSGVLQ